MQVLDIQHPHMSKFHIYCEQNAELLLVCHPIKANLQLEMSLMFFDLLNINFHTFFVNLNLNLNLSLVESNPSVSGPIIISKRFLTKCVVTVFAFVGQYGCVIPHASCRLWDITYFLSGVFHHTQITSTCNQKHAILEFT